MLFKKQIKMLLIILAVSPFLVGCPEDAPPNHPCHLFSKEQCMPSTMVDAKKLLYDVSNTPVSVETVVGGQCFPRGEAETLLAYAKQQSQDLIECLDQIKQLE